MKYNFDVFIHRNALNVDDFPLTDENDREALSMGFNDSERQVRSFLQRPDIVPPDTAHFYDCYKDSFKRLGFDNVYIVSEWYEEDRKVTWIFDDLIEAAGYFYGLDNKGNMDLHVLRNRFEDECYERGINSITTDFHQKWNGGFVDVVFDVLYRGDVIISNVHISDLYGSNADELIYQIATTAEYIDSDPHGYCVDSIKYTYGSEWDNGEYTIALSRDDFETSIDVDVSDLINEKSDNRFCKWDNVFNMICDSIGWEDLYDEYINSSSGRAIDYANRDNSDFLM